MLLAAFGSVDAARGQATCPAQGSCSAPHANPGCENTECCQLVCSADPFCCQVQWDDLCADAGYVWCVASCGGPLAGDCLAPGTDPACDDPACCDAICSIDAFCCEQLWDELCAEAAVEICLLSCGGSLSGDCLQPHANPSCNDVECCEEVCAADAFCCQQAWDELCAAMAWDLCVSCGTPPNASCTVAHPTPGCGNAACCEAVCSYDSFCCLSAWDALCAQAAQILCVPCGAPTAGSCFAPHGPGCDDELCCLSVCIVDSFCCTTSWDATCVAFAIEVCGACGNPGAGACFVPHASPHCEDELCCDAVCALDPFCCESEWDELCAQEAAATCGGCGAPEAPSCLVPHATAGCDDLVCCGSICAADPFCCDIEWDILCVDLAEATCTFSDCYGLCDGDLDRSGDVDAGDLAVLLGTWGTNAACGDLDGNGLVGPPDLARLLGAWGPCGP
jgi:hypothetical protein